MSNYSAAGRKAAYDSAEVARKTVEEGKCRGLPTIELDLQRVLEFSKLPFWRDLPSSMAKRADQFRRGIASTMCWS